jgi:hypothetical protein
MRATKHTRPRERFLALLCLISLLCSACLADVADVGSPDRAHAAAPTTATPSTPTTPTSPSPSIAICAVVKDDADHVLEWVEHHLWLGVERLYVFDDGSPQPLARALHRFGPQKVVVLPVPPNASSDSTFAASPQGLAYNACIARYCGRHDYMAFIDADEFIMVNDTAARGVGAREGQSLPGRWQARRDHHHDRRHPPPRSLPSFIGQHFDRQTTAGVLMNWVVFAGGHVSKPAGGILRNYVRCLPRAHPKSRVVKTLASCAFVSGAANPHTMVYGGGHGAAAEVDEWGAPLGHDGTYAERAASPPPHRLFLQHYMFKSEQEAAAKLRAGSGSGWRKTEEYYREVVEAASERCEFAVGL